MAKIQPISNVLVVGAGWVGRQVAGRMAQYRVNVCLYDREPSIAREAQEWIQRVALEGDGARCQSLVRIIVDLDSLQSLEATGLPIDMALECVSEQASLKKRVLKQISQAVAADCIIASNSSYFVPSLLCQYVSRPSRFAHMHFHVPVLRPSVCDIVGCEHTVPIVLERLVDLAERIHQPPILLRREHPGYIFNWLLQSVLKGALELSALGVVDPQQVDQSWKAVTGMPLGPFGIMDQIGLDVVEQVLSNGRWAEQGSTASAKTELLLQVLRPLINAGRLGVKTKAGFYDYNSDELAS